MQKPTDLSHTFEQGAEHYSRIGYAHRIGADHGNLDQTGVNR